MTMDQDDRQSSGNPGKSEGSGDDNTREGTKEDFRSKDEEQEKAASKDTPDNLRDGTKS